MDHVVRLLPGQTQFQSFDHDLLNNADAHKISEEDWSEASRQEKQLSLMWVVRRLVGCYLYHWPIVESWIDEMCSAGLQAVCEFDDLDDQDRLMNKLQYEIEVTINNHRSVVHSSFMTNRRRSANGKPLEYAETESLHNVGAEDMDLLQAQHIDQLKPEDQIIIYENRYSDNDENN